MSSPLELVLAVLLAFPAWGQEQPPANPAPPPVLENTGKPMLVPFQCTEDDMRWAGLACSEEDPCDVYLEVALAEPAGQRIFASANIHTDAATLYSVLLGSDDGGRTWREAHERIRGAGLDHIQFLGADTGWISGLSLSPLPQDPFLLVTNDGGKTWRQRLIFSETRVGSIHQFFFGAKDSGSLIIDRGPGSEGGRWERFESPDGGDTWMIKETSDKPLGLKQQPAAPSDWRVRADAPTKSFHIERRQGTRWASVAAFAVNLGVCKPQ